MVWAGGCCIGKKAFPWEASSEGLQGASTESPGEGQSRRVRPSPPLGLVTPVRTLVFILRATGSDWNL